MVWIPIQVLVEQANSYGYASFLAQSSVNFSGFDWKRSLGEFGYAVRDQFL